MSSTLTDNIETLRKRAERDRAATPLSQRLAQAITNFSGSMAFVFVHLVAFAAWAAWNLTLAARPFDPQLIYLATFSSVEAIFLSTFVLIRQNRDAELDRRRDDLDLHISLLTEHELTKLAALVARIADKVGVVNDDPGFQEITKDVEPARVLDTLEEGDKASGR